MPEKISEGFSVWNNSFFYILELWWNFNLNKSSSYVDLAITNDTFFSPIIETCIEQNRDKGTPAGL